MTSNNVPNAIPRDVALGLCAEIREANQKWYKWTTWMCWGCTTFAKGDVDKMCWHNPPQNRGCVQVNARYDAP